LVANHGRKSDRGAASGTKKAVFPKGNGVFLTSMCQIKFMTGIEDRLGEAMFRFKCTSCNEWHEGMPTFGADAPLYFYGIPAEERANRCILESDTCVIDQEHFFVRGCLEIPVHGETESFIWGVWISLSRKSFEDFVACFDAPKRSHVGPFFGWLSAELALYPSTENLKARVHLRNDGVRPHIELEPTNHPLAIEQRNGISADRVAEIYAYYVHRQA
jgi:hypothetical protein